MYRFSRGRTKPQAILMLCSFMMFIVVAINVFVYLLIPQYSIYGDQHYAFTANVCNNLLILDTRESKSLGTQYSCQKLDKYIRNSFLYYENFNTSQIYF